MNYQNVVLDFVHRTRMNLEYIENRVHDPNVAIFETTQLINSMLGLLVFPEQRYFNNIPPTQLKELVKQGWPEVNPTPSIEASPDFKDCNTLRDLMKVLRNSIAHFNIKFIADENNEISGLRVWNINPNKPGKPKTWEAEISLRDLRTITSKFIELMEKDFSENN